MADGPLELLSERAVDVLDLFKSFSIYIHKHIPMWPQRHCHCHAKNRERERETVETMAMRMNVNRLRMIATAQNDTQSDAWRYDSFKRYFWNGLHISWLQLLIRINCAEHLFFIFDCKTATKWDNTRIYWYDAHTHTFHLVLFHRKLVRIETF